MEINLITLLAFVIGAALASAVFIIRLMKTERKNAELEARIQAGQDALQQTSEVLDARFKATAQDALKQTTEQFMQLAQERLKGVEADKAHDLEKRQRAIHDMVKPVSTQLEAMKTALEQVQGTDKSLREELQMLNRETAKLVGALRDPAAQGKWGEFILEGLLEKSGLIKGVHYETQVSISAGGSQQRPDAIISMQDGYNIIVDAKAPINELTQRLSDDLTEDDYNALMAKLAKQVREHVKALGKKGYWENIPSPDFTVLFLPSEHIYSMALRSDPGMVDFAADNNVIIASPTLLMSLLRVVSLSWRQADLAQNAAEISELGQELYKRLLKFTDHFEKVGKNIGQALRGYNDAVGSLERTVLPSARKFKDLQGQATNAPDLDILTQADENPRLINLAQEDEDEKRKQAKA